jgi:hypothetical protein
MNTSRKSSSSPVQASHGQRNQHEGDYEYGTLRIAGAQIENGRSKEIIQAPDGNEGKEWRHCDS